MSALLFSADGDFCRRAREPHADVLAAGLHSGGRRADALRRPCQRRDLGADRCWVRLARFFPRPNRCLIQYSHAPPSILNVSVGQRVDVQVQKRTEEDYVPPPLKPFHGTGNRLGAPTSASASASTSATRVPASITTRFAVDQTLPTTSVQVRLADGTRCVNVVPLPPLSFGL